MDLSLVSIVEQLEQEAERIIQAANRKAAEEKSAAIAEANSLIKSIREDALKEAGRIQSEAAAQLEKELSEAQRIFSSSMDEKIRRAKAKIKEPVQIIIQRLASI